MLITQFMLEGLDDKEATQVLGFVNMLREVYCSEFSGNIMKLKINLRIKYLYKVPWIKWKRKYITPEIILDTIYNSIKVKKQNILKNSGIFQEKSRKSVI